MVIIAVNNYDLAATGKYNTEIVYGNMAADKSETNGDVNKGRKV